MFILQMGRNDSKSPSIGELHLMKDQVDTDNEDTNKGHLRQEITEAYRPSVFSQNAIPSNPQAVVIPGLGMESTGTPEVTKVIHENMKEKEGLQVHVLKGIVLEEVQ